MFRFVSHSLVIIVFAASVLFFKSARASPIPLQSSLTLSVSAYECNPIISCDPGLGQHSSGGGLDSQGATLNNLLAAASVSLAPSFPTVNASESWTASFTNAAQGAVSFETKLTTGLQGTFGYAFVYFLTDNGFFYSFVADASGDLVVDSMIVTTGNFIDISTYFVELTGLSGQRLPANGAGSVTFQVVAGTQYTLGVLDLSNCGRAGTCSIQNSAHVTFSIPSASSVPESSTLMLLSTAVVPLSFVGLRRVLLLLRSN